MNHLNNQRSPYLLQHKDQPVDWYPWCAQAFEKARREDKPIFLSIGYSTCHWCHVMARESFEDSQVAQLLNQSFISIKVDREERPDIDFVYLNACHAMAGQGGWPLTILMNAEQKPFFAATYLPKNSRYGVTGLLQLLSNIAQIWEKQRQALFDVGEEVTRTLNSKAPALPSSQITFSLLENAAQEYETIFDSSYGGFGPAPKFPMAHNLLFLMEYAKNNEAAQTMVETTLLRMYQGGLFDHIGGGFSRYSTDEKWLIPHFEKMLYDNAMLLYLYSTAYCQKNQDFYRYVAQQTGNYVLRELRSEQGGFYCGQDADSDGVEGKYYTFTPSEIATVLGEEKERAFCDFFQITPQGNFEGKSVPNRLNQPFQLPPEGAEKLLSYRKDRVMLATDKKILASWNGMMIAALARAYAALEQEEFLDAAKKAAQFVEEQMQKDGRLFVSYFEGTPGGEGKLEDYTSMAWGMLELYQVTFDVFYLEKACALMQTAYDHFWDAENGGFFAYADDGEPLIARLKESYDGAMPSPNSVASFVLNKLSMLCASPFWTQLAEKQNSFLAAQAVQQPTGYGFWLYGLFCILAGNSQIIAVSPSVQDLQKLRKMLVKNAGLCVLVKNSENQNALGQLAEYTKEYSTAEGTKFYQCADHQCHTPLHELPNEMLR